MKYEFSLDLNYKILFFTFLLVKVSSLLLHNEVTVVESDDMDNKANEEAESKEPPTPKYCVEP